MRRCDKSGLMKDKSNRHVGSYWNLSPRARRARNKRTAQLNQLRRYNIWYDTFDKKSQLKIYGLRKKSYGPEYFRCAVEGCSRWKKLLTGRTAAEAHLLSHKGIVKSWQEFRSPFSTHDEYKAYMKRMKETYLKPFVPRIRKADLDVVIRKAKDEFNKKAAREAREQLKDLANEPIEPSR